MTEHIDRRRFLEFLTVLGTGSLAGRGDGHARASNSSDRSTDGKRVVVLGGGLAGLTAAYNLMHRGYDVIVLEGQNRIGGRVLTARDAFKAGGHAEMGATRIFSTHTATLKYVNLFGLGPLKPYDGSDRAFYMRGQRFKSPSAGQSWPVAGMSDAEKVNPFAFLGRYLGSGMKKLGNPDTATWPNSEPS